METDSAQPDASTNRSRTWNFGVSRPWAAGAAVFCLLFAVVGPMLFLLSPVGDANHTEGENAQPEDPAAGYVVRIGGSLFFFVGGGILAYAAARGGCRYQSLTIDEDFVSIDYSFLGRSRRQRYRRKYIGDLRVHEDVPDVSDDDGFDPDHGGSLAFQYGARTVFFGPEAGRPRAETILWQLLEFAPELSGPAPVVQGSELGLPGELRADGSLSPADGRFVLHQGADGLRVTIPARSSQFTQSFVSAWLVMWAAGLGAAAYFLWRTIGSLNGRPGAPSDDADAPAVIAFISIWLCIWIPGGLLCVFSLVWSRWGRQIIEISDSSIAVCNRSPLWRSCRLIDRTKYGPISLRTSLGYFESFTTGNDRGDSSGRGGWLECRSGYSKEYFGAGLTRREAQHLLIRLQRIDPTLVELESVQKSN